MINLLPNPKFSIKYDNKIYNRIDFVITKVQFENK